MRTPHGIRAPTADVSWETPCVFVDLPPGTARSRKERDLATPTKGLGVWKERKQAPEPLGRILARFPPMP